MNSAISIIGESQCTDHLLIFQNAERNNSLYMASMEQQIADENVLRLVKQHKVNALFLCIRAYSFHI